MVHDGTTRFDMPKCFQTAKPDLRELLMTDPVGIIVTAVSEWLWHASTDGNDLC